MSQNNHFVTDSEQRQPQLLYLGKSTPQQFINVKIGDWIYLVGDVTTAYEVKFVKQFGLALNTSHNNAGGETGE